MRGAASHYVKPYNLDSIGIYIYALGVSLACWVVGYIDSVGYPVYGEVTATPLWNSICRNLPSKEFTYIIGLALMLGGAYLLHRANYALVLIREKTLLPFLLYVLLLSTNPYFFPLKPTSLGAFCLIWGIYQLFTSYHDPDSTPKAFNAAFFIGVASLLWVHILWFIPLFWIGMYQFRSLNIRTFIASLLGVGTVYWFLLAWCVWQGDYSPFTVPFPSLFRFNLQTMEGVDIVDWLSLAYVIILILISSVYIRMHEYEDSPRTRQFISFLMLFTFWIFCMFVLYEDSSEELLQVACIPSAILIAHYMSVKRNKFTYLLFHFTVVFYITLLLVRLWNSL